MTELKHDPEFLFELRRRMDECYEEVTKRVPTVELTKQLTDLRDYFLFLTLDALEDEALARKLVPEFERLPRRTKFHLGFFFALLKLLSLKHPVITLPEVRRFREEFVRSFERTAWELGIY